MRLFVFSAWYSYKALFRWLKWEAYIFQKTLFPLVQLTFFVVAGIFSGSQPASFYLVGNAIVVAFRPMFAVAMAIRDERAQGTLPYLVASPANRHVIFFARSALHAVDGIFDIVLAFAFAALVFGLPLPVETWPGLIAAIVVASVAACGIGFLLGALSYVVLDVLFMGNLMMFGLLLLTGANVPLGELPDWARAVALALPLTRSVEAARLYQAGADFGAGIPLLGAEIVVTALWAAAGLALFTLLEVQARRRGTLEGV